MPNLKMRNIPIIIVILTGILLNSCCLLIKEKHLGNNLYLSEYDNIDRRILYSEKRCTGSGVEIVPMTVLDISYDSKWIIAKSGSMDQDSTYEYWIIKNHYETPPDATIIKSNTLGPLTFEIFQMKLQNNNIDLKLKEIN